MNIIDIILIVLGVIAVIIYTAVQIINLKKGNNKPKKKIDDDVVENN